MHEHPKVRLAAAVGRPDAYAGELPVVYVELEDGAKCTVDELVAFAKDNISEKAAWPKAIQVLETMPVTPVGKIFKPACRCWKLSTSFGQKHRLKVRRFSRWRSSNMLNVVCWLR